MVNQPELPTYDAGVYEWELTDPVQGGLHGVANIPLLNLANRTAYLKQRLDSLVAGTLIPPTVAPLNGAQFTGSTTAPNVRPGDNSTLIANTDFVQTAVAGIVYAVVAGVTTLTLTQDQWGVGIIIFIGAMTGNTSVIFPNKTGKWVVSNNTTGNYILTVKTATGAGVIISAAYPRVAIFGDGTSGIYVQNSPFLLLPTGVVAGGYGYASLAVGADGRITSINANAPVTSLNGRTGAVGLSFADITNALGWTPVQQGGGVAQGVNKVYIGWDGAAPRISVDTTDQGQFMMRNQANFSALGADVFTLKTPCQAGTTLITQMGGVGVPAVANTEVTTLFTLATAFPNSHVGAICSFLGNTPPLGGSISIQPYDLTRVQITTSSPGTTTLGVVYLCFGY